MRQCSVDKCERKHYAKGYCSMHWWRLYNGRPIGDYRPKLIYHGLTGPLYGIWYQMLQRCNNPKDRKYPYYGGRGITVCERWESLTNFVGDMGERPKGLTLDRIDNDGNYEPLNCRWASYTEQNMNRRLQSNNTSGHRGVYWDKGRKKWVVTHFDRHVGRYATKDEAIRVRKDLEQSFNENMLEENE